VPTDSLLGLLQSQASDLLASPPPWPSTCPREQKAKALAAGFDIHLVKPVDAPRLSALLSQPANLEQTSRARSSA
jgi:hypothetical protein